MEKYENLISLGYVCNVTSFLNVSQKRDTAYVFDRIATPMWSVNELIKNDFSDLLKDENVKCVKLFEESPRPIPYDSKYYIRLPLNENNYESRLASFREKLVERAERFKDVLKSESSVLFIRDEEPDHYSGWGERVSMPEYDEKYKKSEKEYLQELCVYLKSTYPNLKFKILFLNKEGQFVDDNKLIVGIPRSDIDFRDVKAGPALKKHIKEHSDFLNANL